MARVVVFLQNVWHCPRCDMTISAKTRRSVITTAEFHLGKDHAVICGSDWDPVIELKHWAYNIRPDDPADRSVA